MGRAAQFAPGDWEELIAVQTHLAAYSRWCGDDVVDDAFAKAEQRQGQADTCPTPARLLGGGRPGNPASQPKTYSKTFSATYGETPARSDLLMAHRVLTETAVSISEHKKNPMATVAAGEGMAVAVLNRNEPVFYCVPARAYEELMDLVDDLELGRIADARLADGQKPVRVSLDAL
jgi:antitoxin StbD